VAESLRIELRALLLDMNREPRGRKILARAQLERFKAAHDSDYDPIRRMARKAKRVLLA
jgi:ABC-type phosphate/phosphonate transport system substrate-binding protein